MVMADATVYSVRQTGYIYEKEHKYARLVAFGTAGCRLAVQPSPARQQIDVLLQCLSVGPDWP